MPLTYANISYFIAKHKMNIVSYGLNTAYNTSESIKYFFDFFDIPENIPDKEDDI